MVYTLREPVTKGERTVEKLNFTDRPKVRHLLGMDTYRDGSVAQMVQLICSLTEESPEIIKELSPEDYAEVRLQANTIYTRFVVPQKGQEVKADPTEPTVSEL